MKKLTFEHLTIEITRNCNMQCGHCLRGEPQNVNIDHSYIDALLDQTQLVGGLTLTGGEPMLCLDTIEYIVDGLCKRGIPLLNFLIYTNGLMYNERFIKIIKRYKSLIDVSCSNCFVDGDNYKSEDEVSRCIVGVSLDRYHEHHDICEEHYKKYKEALYGYADVLKVMHGNQPAYAGRARCLNVRTINTSHVYKICPLQRIEILSKEHTPVCKAYNTYHMLAI